MARSPKGKTPSSPDLLSPARYRRLVDALQRLLEQGRQRAEQAVGRELVRTYHAVGSRILAQKLTGRAGYGTAMLQRIADDLSVDRRTLQRAVAFAQAYPDGPPSGDLRWGHYRELLVLPEAAQRSWYESEAAAQSWSVRKLRQAVRTQQHRSSATGARAKPTHQRGGVLRRPADSTYVYRAAVERVVDGDTLLCLIDLGFQVHKSQRLRLAAIDTAALGTPAGDRARDLVQHQLAQVDFVVVKTDKIDLYGRYVAHVFYEPGETDKHRVFTAGQYLNQRLVDDGVASVL